VASKKRKPKRDWASLDPSVVGGVLMDLISQPDIVAAEKCGKACLILNFRGGRQYRIDKLPISLAPKIPALVNKVRELSLVPF
jgi:hypothetical protein